MLNKFLYEMGRFMIVITREQNSLEVKESFPRQSKRPYEKTFIGFFLPLRNSAVFS